jgi:hypothetical protein
MRVSEIDWHGRGSRRFDLPGEADLDERPDPRSAKPHELPGGNRPPRDDVAPPPAAEMKKDTVLDFATTAMGLMDQFLNDNPVINDGATAEAAKVQIKTAQGCLSGMEDERDEKVRPLNDRVKAINATYSVVRAPFEKVLTEVRRRLTAYGRALEVERERIAEIARQKAQALVDAAREAQRLEQEAIDNARQGEFDAGVAARIVEADAAAAEARKAIRQANVADRDTTVRIGGGGGGARAMGMRTNETLTLDDAIAAIKAMGAVSEKTRESILTDARAYRKLNGSLPAGVSSVKERQF